MIVDTRCECAQRVNCRLVAPSYQFPRNRRTAWMMLPVWNRGDFEYIECAYGVEQIIGDTVVAA